MNIKSGGRKKRKKKVNFTEIIEAQKKEKTDLSKEIVSDQTEGIDAKGQWTKRNVLLYMD